MWTSSVTARRTLTAIKCPLWNPSTKHIVQCSFFHCGDTSKQSKMLRRITNLQKNEPLFLSGKSSTLTSSRLVERYPLAEFRREFSSNEDENKDMKECQDIEYQPSTRVDLGERVDTHKGSQLEESNNLYRLPVHDPTPETRADEFHRLPLKCNSCGAYMQTEKADHHGFIDPKKFPSLLKNSFEDFICSNCHSLKYRNKKSITSVSKDSIMRQFQHLPVTQALVLYVVDVTDLHGSIFPDLLDVIGRRKRIIIVGNKVDMLATDDHPRKQEVNFIKILKKHNIEEDKEIANIKDACLVSGKTGYGMEKLLVLINKYRDPNMDLYIVGCSNVGKSAIYNMLQNLMCISKSAEIPPQAISHHLPGTTLGLLRHPLTLWRIRKTRRMLLEKPVKVENDEEKMEFVEEIIDEINVRKKKKNTAETEMENVEVIPSRPENQREFQFVDPSEEENDRCWMYDTPGLMNTNQITQFLNQKELQFIQQSLWRVPKTFILKPGSSLLIGGLARIDFCEITRQSQEDPSLPDRIPKASQSVFFTLFCSNSIPVHPTTIEKASEFLDKHFGDHLLKVPFADDERQSEFPPLQPREHEVTGVGWDMSCADVYIAGLGWFAITAGKESRVKLQVYTPDGIGQHLNTECLMPYSVKRRGKRGVRHIGALNKKMYACTRKQNPQLISSFEQQNEIVKEWIKKITEKQKLQRFLKKEERRQLLLEQGIVGKMRQLAAEVDLIEIEAAKAKALGPGDS